MTETDDVIIVDHFESGKLTEWNGRYDVFDDVYSVEATDDGHILRAYSEDSDNFILKRIKVDLMEYPYLNWRWKADILPLDGDESVKKYCDVAASVNVVLKLSKWRPRSIKYSWSTTLPKQTFTKSPYAIWPSRTDIVVLQSGMENAGTWQTEKVNVLNHYQRLYHRKKIKSCKVEAIVLMTDSDNTGTPSRAFYDDLFFSKE